MRTFSFLVLCYTLAACTAASRPVRWVPADEAAWFKFGTHLPDTGRRRLPGEVVAALQLAADTFLPWEQHLPAGASRSDICIRQRQSWDVDVAPGAPGTQSVRFSLAPGACYRWGPPMDTETTAVVDVRDARLVEQPPAQPPPELPTTERIHLEGNSAASLLLALEDFLPAASSPPAEARPEEACLYRRQSYDVTLAPPGPEGVAQILFTLNEEACPTGSLRGSSAALARLDMTVYAVDVRTLRLLAVGSLAHLRLGWKDTSPVSHP